MTVKNQLHVCAEVKSLLRSDSRHQIVDWIFPGMFEENLFLEGKVVKLSSSFSFNLRTILLVTEFTTLTYYIISCPSIEAQIYMYVFMTPFE